MEKRGMVSEMSRGRVRTRILQSLLVCAGLATALLSSGCASPIMVTDLQVSGIPGQWSVHTPPKMSAMGNHVRDLMFDRQGRLWVATERTGVFAFDGRNWTRFNYRQGLISPYAYCLAEDSRGTVWCGNTGAVSIYNGQRWSPVLGKRDLGGSEVLSCMTDLMGRLWFGTLGKGVFVTDGAGWSHLTVGQVVQTSSGVSISPGQVDMLSRNMGKNLAQGAALGMLAAAVSGPRTNRGYFHNDNVIRAMLVDRGGNLWFGGGDKLSNKPKAIWRCTGMDWNTATRMRSFDQYSASGRGRMIAEGVVNAIFQDRTGAMWFGVRGHGLLRYDGANWSDIPVSDRRENNVVFAIHQDKTGRIWLATGAGIKWHDGQNWVTHGKDLVVRAMAEDPFGNLWFGTGGKAPGIIKYTPAR